MNEELKSCPFCKSDNIEEVKYDSKMKPALYRVVCKGCYCGTNWYAGDGAVEAWNIRA